MGMREPPQLNNEATDPKNSFGFWSVHDLGRKSPYM